jgi:hypothetical protein
MKKIAVLGGGIAGVTTALELVKNDTNTVTLFESKAHILEGTSARTPGRMGLGFHYLADLNSAYQYLHSTVGFARQFPGFILNRGESHLTRGRYFLVDDPSQRNGLSLHKIMSVIQALQSTYASLCQHDPANQSFGPPDQFFRVLKQDQFSDRIASDKVILGIETCEALLDWVKFSNHLKKLVCHAQNLSIFTNTPVKTVHPIGDYGFYINGEQFDQVVNCTWENMQSIAALAKLTSPNTASLRIKLLAEVHLPPMLQDMHSSFFCVGPYAMFSNMGKGIGRLTYAPVTNYFHTQEAELPQEMASLVTQCTQTPAIEHAGRQIIDGVAQFIPAMRYASLKKVYPGIVRTYGTNMDIYDPKSDIHRRRERGIEQLSPHWVNNGAMKLFHALVNARDAAVLLHADAVHKEII